MSKLITQLSRCTISLFAVGLLAMSPFTAHAMTSGSLEVQFAGGTTLFGTDAVVPGSADAKTVTVTNHGSQTETVYTKPINYTSTGLATGMTLGISATSTGSTYFTGTFATFFAPSPVALGTLAPGATRTYSFAASFATSSANAYQNTTMAFDLMLGFAGGPSVVVPGGGGSPSGSGGGGGYVRRFNTSTTTPSGQVLGASTTRSYPSILKSIADRVAGSPVGSVLGIRSTHGSSTVVAPAAGATTSAVRATSTPSPASAHTADDAVCTLIWLGTLLLISGSWSIYHDLFQRTLPIQQRFFGFNLLAQGGYLLILIGLWFSHGLVAWQWLPLVWWITLVTIDSVWHARVGLDLKGQRFQYYSALSILAILMSWTIGVPCTWWPFAILLMVSIGVWRWPRKSTVPPIGL